MADTVAVVQENNEFKDDILEQALFDKAGRRYGANNRQPKYKRKNPVKNGKVMKCRGCDSEYHFIRDCPKVKKAVLVNLLLDGSLAVDPSIVQSLTVDQITDIFQNLADEVWSEYAPNVLLTESQIVDVPSTSSVMITFLHECTTYHELFKGK